MATKKTAPKSAKTTTETTFEDATAYAGAWGEAAREQYETALKTFNDNAEKFRTQTEDAIETARQGFDAANERMRAAGADAMTVAREEMNEAVEFVNELARARTIGDALTIQQGYWTKLFETRVERARAMTEASVEATREAFEPMTRNYASAFSFAPAFEKFFPFSAK
jgi:hypothetical protein